MKDKTKGEIIYEEIIKISGFSIISRSRINGIKDYICIRIIDLDGIINLETGALQLLFFFFVINTYPILKDYKTLKGEILHVWKNEILG